MVQHSSCSLEYKVSKNRNFHVLNNVTMLKDFISLLKMIMKAANGNCTHLKFYEFARFLLIEIDKTCGGASGQSSLFIMPTNLILGKRRELTLCIACEYSLHKDPLKVILLQFLLECLLYIYYLYISSPSAWVELVSQRGLIYLFRAISYSKYLFKGIQDTVCIIQNASSVKSDLRRYKIKIQI